MLATLCKKSKFFFYKTNETPFHLPSFFISGTTEAIPSDTNQNLQNEDTDTQPVGFGKLFEKTHNFAKQKSETKFGESTDHFLDKFKTRLKSKQTVLPSSLTNLVSLHRKKYGETDYEIDSYDTVDGDINLTRKNTKKGTSDDVDIFDNDFEKEFQKVIEERSTYTEIKSHSGRPDMFRKEAKLSHHLEDSDKLTEMEKTESEKNVNNRDAYEFEDSKAESTSQVNFTSGKRNRISRLKAPNRKAEMENGDISLRREKSKTEPDNDHEIDMKGGNDSDIDFDSGDDNAESRKSRKRKTKQSTDGCKAKRRKTNTEVSVVCILVLVISVI